MTINEIWEFLRGLDLGWTGAAILLLLSLIQISPIKLNPWAIIMAGASVIAYIVGEGLVDVARGEGGEKDE